MFENPEVILGSFLCLPSNPTNYHSTEELNAFSNPQFFQPHFFLKLMV